MLCERKPRQPMPARPFMQRIAYDAPAPRLTWICFIRRASPRMPRRSRHGIAMHAFHHVLRIDGIHDAAGRAQEDRLDGLAVAAEIDRARIFAQVVRVKSARCTLHDEVS